MRHRSQPHRAPRAVRRNLWRISLRVGEGASRRRPLWETFNRVIGKPTIKMVRT